MDQPLEVKVRTEYLESQSQPAADQFAFAYFISIVNHGDRPATLMSRHWIITDANGEHREIEGDGVVGEQPRIEPGKSFSYSSYAVLETSVGTMQGSYQMQGPDGESFAIPIEPFLLALPGTIN